MPQRFYRPELDVIRLTAFLAVFFHHILSRNPYRVGIFMATLGDDASFGLPLFFVLSAFLITTLLLREIQSTGTVSVSRFYKRRILRIWPLYFATLLTGVLISMHHHLFHIEWPWYLAALLMLGNLTNCLPYTALWHLWSISVEEQFYLIWPSLMRWLSRRELVAFAGLLIVAANLMLVYDSFHHVSPDYVIWFNSVVQFEMFAAGILLAIFTANPRVWLTSNLARFTLAAIVPVIWYVAEYYSHIKRAGQVSLGPFSLCLGYASVAISCALLIYALLGSTGWPKWLVHMGKVSYGLYVFHLPVITLLEHSPFARSFRFIAIPALILTSVLALVSYRFFETPFLKIKQRLEVIPSRPIEGD